MATLRNIGLLVYRRQNYLQARLFSSSSPLAKAIWNKDWMPDPLPKTPEERASAAKKYGLRPEDYDILPDGMSGNYPNLPQVSHHLKDPYEDYDYPGLKMNYGEAMHQDWDLIGRDAEINSGGQTLGRIVGKFLLCLGALAGSYYLLKDIKFFLPEMPKQYPFNNLHMEYGGDPSTMTEVKHYTFEPADEASEDS